MKWGQIIKRNKELGDLMHGPLKKIALISNATIFQLKDILELDLREAGLSVRIDIGDYNNIIQDSERFSKYDAVIIFWELSNLSEDFHYKNSLFTDEKIEALINKVEAEIRLTLKNLKSVPLVLINEFTAMPFDLEVLSKSRLKSIANHLNNSLKNIISSNQIIVDIEKIITMKGLELSLDYRQFQISKSLYTKEFYINYANQIKPAFLANSGITKKVLVLDCDNTLWGGILGEDGEDSIEMSNLTVRGESFCEVQHLIKGFQEKGILLALCSKNNPEDVDHILKMHPDMVLKYDDFVAKKVNWTDKAKNLIELSEELNLGLDSFIFVDDSEFEIGLIQKTLPMVKSILVPKEISKYPITIRALIKDFFSFSMTEEDLKKTSMYKEEQKRAGEAKTFENMDDYLSSLGLELSVVFDEDVSVIRASQLTKKTNQFNLRTQRYSETEISKFISCPEYLVSAFSLVDKYGDYGVTGLCIVNLKNQKIFFDTLLMSCRVIGRNIEYNFFTQIINRLKKMFKSDKTLEAEWVLTNKNKQVKNLYEELGFPIIAETENLKNYKFKLSDYVEKDKKYIQIRN